MNENVPAEKVHWTFYTAIFSKVVKEHVTDWRVTSL